MSQSILLAVDGTFKRCSRCFVPKPLREFSRAARHSDGRRSECKFCHSKMQAADYRATALAKQRLARYQMQNDDAISALKRCVSTDHNGPNPLPVELFSVADHKTGRISSHCKICAIINADRWYRANLEQAQETREKYAKENHEKKLSRDRVYIEANKIAINERRRAKYNKDSSRVNATNRRKAEKQRNLVFGHYGKKCACCGNIKRLEIDHVEGNGIEHRKSESLLNGSSFYTWLIKNDFPTGYQTLCRSCNASKSNGPYCRLKHLR